MLKLTEGGLSEESKIKVFTQHVEYYRGSHFVVSETAKCLKTALAKNMS